MACWVGCWAAAARGSPALAGAATAAILRQRGLRVDSGRFADFIVPVRPVERLSEPVDVCLVTVKATQLHAALQRLPAEVLGSALLVPLLNGVEHVPALSVGGVVAATIRVESTGVAPAHVRHDSPFASVELAPATS